VTFTLRSGQISQHYFDKYQFESSPALLSCIAERMAEPVPEGTEVLAGLKLGRERLDGAKAVFSRAEPVHDEGAVECLSRAARAASNQPFA